jgi:hypothetical protein
MTPETAAALAAGEVWCQTCQDTGMAWASRATGRQESTPPAGSHADYVVRPCSCRAMNPLYRAKVDRASRGRRERE